MENQNQSIIIGGLVTGLVAILFNFLAISGSQTGQLLAGAGCCLAVIAGALVAVWHYTSTEAVTLQAGQGAKLGALACVLGGVISTVLSYLLRFVGIFPGPNEQMEIARQRMIDQGMDDAQLDQALKMVEMFSSPGAQIGIIVVSLLLMAVLGAAFGAVGASMFKKGEA